jgi:predicted RNA-binding protein (virulence factor B family)
MVSVGKMNRLKVVKQESFGLYLDAEYLGNVLLPNRYVPSGVKIGDSLDVFIYLDSEDIPIATTETPLAMVGQCAYLKVVDVNNVGAFMDWGLSKDLLVPFGEQHKPFELGKSYVVCIYLDDAFGRITGSSKLSRHLQEFSSYFKPDQEVSLIICGKSDMGFKAVIDHTHLGLIFKDEAFKPLYYGSRVQGYVKNIRDDRKIDLSLQLSAAKGRGDLVEQIIDHLKANGGVSHLTDKSPPDEIYRVFNVSKGSYKKALGQLYKQRKISIELEQITLIRT